jgi:hypothetical protein
MSIHWQEPTYTESQQGVPGYFILQSQDDIDLSWHADRYESAKALDDALSEGLQDVDDPSGWNGVHVYHLTIDAIEEVLRATLHDGGDEGTIPCLGGDIEACWRFMVAHELGSRIVAEWDAAAG